MVNNLNVLFTDTGKPRCYVIDYLKKHYPKNPVKSFTEDTQKNQKEIAQGFATFRQNKIKERAERKKEKRKQKRAKKKAPVIVKQNKHGRVDNWAWKPDYSQNKKSTGNKAKRSRVTRKQDKDFYTSREWRELRYRVLRKHGSSCMCCGKNYKDHGVVIHVDHIKPRSKFPELSLEFTNLQVLCEDCNIGKSNKFADDWS